MTRRLLTIDHQSDGEMMLDTQRGSGGEGCCWCGLHAEHSPGEMLAFLVTVVGAKNSGRGQGG